MARNPIPPPTVTVRSEYPTLTRSRQSQTLTCLVTIEVPEGKWSPDPEDLRSAHQLPSMQPEKEVVRPQSPVPSRQDHWSSESPEALEEITEDLRIRVDNWHGLDFSRYVSVAMRVASRFNAVQVRKVAVAWYHPSRQRPPIMAGTRMLPLRRDAHMHQGEERRGTTICRWKFQAQAYQMHA